MQRSDGTCSAKMIGKVLNLSERRVRQLVSHGVVIRHSPGRYELIASIQCYIDFLKGRRNSALRSKQKKHCAQFKRLHQALKMLHADVAVLLKYIPTVVVNNSSNGNAITLSDDIPTGKKARANLRPARENQ